MATTTYETLLVDETDARIAFLDVERVGDHFEGIVRLENTPPELVDLFSRYEEIVSGQVFSLLDAIEAEIDAIALRVRFSEGSASDVTDLQIYPSRNAVSFRLADSAAG